ncbi:hypothetical protein AAHE18_05G036400 [Arachis hypogaea]|nr:uncharacterized protein DS421_5g137010 [Arachis hypogaea]
MTHSSDDDVLGLGNKASGSKKRSPPSDSEDDNEREDRGFQLESPENKRPRTADEDEDDPNPEVFPDCDAQVLHLMSTGVLFVLLVTSGPPTPRQTTQLNEIRAHRILTFILKSGSIGTLLHCPPTREDALHTFPPHVLPQEIADTVAKYAD